MKAIKHIKLMSENEASHYLGTHSNIYKEFRELQDRTYRNRLKMIHKGKDHPLLNNIINFTDLNTSTFEAYVTQILTERITEPIYIYHLDLFKKTMKQELISLESRYNISDTDINKLFYIRHFYMSYRGFKSENNIISDLKQSSFITIHQHKNLDSYNGIDFLTKTTYLTQGIQIKSLHKLKENPKHYTITNTEAKANNYTHKTGIDHYYILYDSLMNPIKTKLYVTDTSTGEAQYKGNGKYLLSYKEIQKIANDDIEAKTFTGSIEELRSYIETVHLVKGDLRAKDQGDIIKYEKLRKIYEYDSYDRYYK